MKRPTIREWMTPSPVTIDRGDILESAHRLMRRHGIRHLPVVDGDQLVGLVSDRDLSIVETLSGVDPQTEGIEEAMTSAPYTVHPDAPVAEVAREMARTRYGSVVVVEDGQVLGIFTTVDALTCLASVLGAEVRPVAEPGSPSPYPR